MRLGLKLWSTNDFYIKPSLEFFNRGLFEYIELYIVPGSLNLLSCWEDVKIPFILHAPHSLSGLNPSLKSSEKRNFELIEEIEEFRKNLNPEFIIFHPGIDGVLEETIRQFRVIRDNFPEIHQCMLVENKPTFGINGENCVGSSHGEIEKILVELEIGFCFDIGHAICAANSSGTPLKDYLQDFFRLEPTMFHLSDGDIDSEKDVHLNIGHGTYEFAEILEQIPNDARITLETGKSSQTDLDDFAEDVRFIRNI